MSRTKVISLRNVDFSYNGIPVLTDVSLDITERELVTIVGPNGGGKTTLLKLILGLLHPDSGTVKVFGAEPLRVRRRIGYMPQYAPLDLKFPVNVMDVVLMGRLERRFFGPYKRTDREAAMAALDEVALAETSRSPFDALSGGQRQRVLIARALATEPELLILDEPTANVDLVAETKLHEILHRLSRHMTILIVSHDIGFVSKVVDKVVCVNRCVAVHPTGEVTPETIRKAYGVDFCIIRHDQHLALEDQHHE